MPLLKNNEWAVFLLHIFSQFYYYTSFPNFIITMISFL